MREARSSLFQTDEVFAVVPASTEFRQFVLLACYRYFLAILICSFVLFAPLVIGQSDNDSDSQLEIAQSWLFRNQ